MDQPIPFETHPDRYIHWQLKFDGPVATLGMNVQEDKGLRADDYILKLNSYDLGVDIELADALNRIRFEHPEVRAVVVTSFKERIFCSGANIFMLGSSTHAFKVNFCKFTNETRLGIEDASENSGLQFLAAINGPCAGGGYELALACDEIFLIDDGSSTVSLPEVPLLGVLPGTGGLTRVVDKRKVRRDRADFFCTVAEGIKGKRAVRWDLVDQVLPRSKFDDAVAKRAAELAEQSDRPADAKGITLEPLNVSVEEDSWTYGFVTVAIDREARTAELTMKAPEQAQAESPDDIVAAGCSFWALQAFRELDDALLRLRMLEPEIGTLLLKTSGDPDAILSVDKTLERHAEHWLVREIIHFMKRTLKRLDMTARSLFALVEPGSCFAGSLLELALASDRSYMLDDPDQDNFIALSAMNFGMLPMGNGLSRLQSRFLDDPDRTGELESSLGDKLDPETAEDEGLVTFAPDDIDWEDEVRIAIEERASLSPDALTGMEANLRYAGPETMETKIFGRLTAWQNWIFQRPNAVGEKGALKVYGKAGMRPEFDWRRT